MKTKIFILSIVTGLALFFAPESQAEDWTTWGRTTGRNMTSPETGLPSSFTVVYKDKFTLDTEKCINIKWAVKLGSVCYGTPAVAEGKVVLGTNACAQNTRAGKYNIYTRIGTVVCLDEKTGALSWQLNVPDERSNDNFCPDGDYLGVCSAPTVENGRVYLITNRNDVLSLQLRPEILVKNTGSITTEVSYMTAGKDLSVPLGETDGDIIWRFNTAKYFGFWAHDVYACSPLIDGNLLYVVTGNSKKFKQRISPKPEEACLMVLDKRTGEILASDTEKMAEAVHHGNWCSPSLAEVNGEKIILYGGPDGKCYAFKRLYQKAPDKKRGSLVKLWSFDPNAGNTYPFSNLEGPADIIGSPIFLNNRVYFVTGRDWSWRNGRGALFCIDATKEGDITKTGLIWKYDGVRQSLSTPAIADGLIYVTDVFSKIHCVDAETGKPYWVYDTGAKVTQSCVIADGKVFVGDLKGNFYIFEHSKTMKLLSKTELKFELSGSPVIANKTIYIPTNRMLFAIALPETTK